MKHWLGNPAVATKKADVALTDGIGTVTPTALPGKKKRPEDAQRVMATKFDQVLKANPYHAEDGKFSTKDNDADGEPSMRGPYLSPKPKAAEGQALSVVKPIAASSVRVGGEDRYAFANGNMPKGRGTWMFSPHKSVDFKKHKQDVDYFQSKSNTMYTEAKAQAKAWAGKNGISDITVQT